MLTCFCVFYCVSHQHLSVCGNTACSKWQMLLSVLCRELLILYLEDKKKVPAPASNAKKTQKIEMPPSVVSLIYFMHSEALCYSRLQLWHHMFKTHYYKTLWHVLSCPLCSSSGTREKKCQSRIIRCTEETIWIWLNMLQSVFPFQTWS